jgi:hypothetical protein
LVDTPKRDVAALARLDPARVDLGYQVVAYAENHVTVSSRIVACGNHHSSADGIELAHGA